jgi:hypothetical protein
VAAVPACRWGKSRIFPGPGRRRLAGRANTSQADTVGRSTCRLAVALGTWPAGLRGPSSLCLSYHTHRTVKIRGGRVAHPFAPFAKGWETWGQTGSSPILKISNHCEQNEPLQTIRENVPSVPGFPIYLWASETKNAKRAPTICAVRKGGTPVGRIPAKVGSLWSLRVWGLRLEISGQAEFFPGPCFF